MCRYSDPNYRTHYVCLSCSRSRKDFKHLQTICAFCGSTMIEAGRDFHTPPARDKKAWAAIVEILTRVPRAYDSCGCGGPGYRPSTPKEAKAWAENVQRRRAARDARNQIRSSFGKAPLLYRW